MKTIRETARKARATAACGSILAVFREIQTGDRVGGLENIIDAGHARFNRSGRLPVCECAKELPAKPRLNPQRRGFLRCFDLGNIRGKRKPLDGTAHRQSSTRKERLNALGIEP